MKVLGISGSLRRNSHNLALLRAAAGVLPPAVERELYEGLAEVPPYSEDDEAVGEPAAVSRLKLAVAEADAVLFATPEYNHSIPGQLKNALDWVSRPSAESPMRFKPAAVIGASTGMFGAVWAQAELRKVLSALGARVLDRELAVGSAGEAFDTFGALRDPELSFELASLCEELCAEAAPNAVLVAA